MLPEEFTEPYIDDDQILEVESYMDELVAHMLEQTEAGQEPVVYYRNQLADATNAVADLIDLIPQLTGKDSKAEAKRKIKILQAMNSLLEFVLLMAHAFETGIPDAEIIATEASGAIIEVQTNATICAMSLLDSINGLGFDFFVQRTSDDFDNEGAAVDILSMLAGLCTLCEHLSVTLFDVMYSHEG